MLFVLHYKEKDSKSDQNMNIPLNYTPFYIIHNVSNRVTVYFKIKKYVNQIKYDEYSGITDYAPFYIIHRKSC